MLRLCPQVIVEDVLIKARLAAMASTVEENVRQHQDKDAATDVSQGGIVHQDSTWPAGRKTAREGRHTGRRQLMG